MWEETVMAERAAERTYDNGEVEDRLQRELPHWRLEGGHIVRTFRTANWKGALMVVNAVGHLAEAAWHHPDMLVGYNSAAYDPNGGDSEGAELRTFHSILVAQANAYMNATWAVAVAKAGNEDGSGLIGGSCIVDPNGRVVAQAGTLDDELILADVDLDACRQGKEKMFNFAAHRRPQWYGPIAERAGVVEPPVAPQHGR